MLSAKKQAETNVSASPDESEGERSAPLSPSERSLEKRHIRRIIFIEYLINMLIISVFSTALGYVLGKFLFIMLNRAMHDMNVRLMDYPFSVYSLVITIAYIGIIFLLLFIDGSRNLKKISAIELMSQSKSKEKEPKLKFVPLAVDRKSVV